MLVILVYWFAAQEQISKYIRQKSRSIFWTFSVEENELIPSFENPLELVQK